MAKTHGMSKTREYRTWASIRQRCQNPNNPAYSYYGGRGIGLCDKWQTFESFYADVGNIPPGMTLDRIDNDRGYEPSNIRFATRQEQSANRRSVKLITIDDTTKTATEWVKDGLISRGTFNNRLYGLGWSRQDALTTPVRADGITYDGITQSIGQWSVTTGISKRTLKARIHEMGWPIDRALTTPVKSCS